MFGEQVREKISENQTLKYINLRNGARLLCKSFNSTDVPTPSRYPYGTDKRLPTAIVPWVPTPASA